MSTAIRSLSPTMEVRMSVELARGIYRAFGKGDIAAVVGGMDANIQWREAEGNPYQPSGAAWVGPDAVVENLFMKLGSEWDGFAVHPEQYHDAGDTVVVEGRYSGKYLATGAEIDSQFCHVFKFEDGKVTSFQQFTDTAQFQTTMGAP
jgi:ketosteroid isomerase-like protein